MNGLVQSAIGIKPASWSNRGGQDQVNESNFLTNECGPATFSTLSFPEADNQQATGLASQKIAGGMRNVLEKITGHNGRMSFFLWTGPLVCRFIK